jgi:hypothetical protein
MKSETGGNECGREQVPPPFSNQFHMLQWSLFQTCLQRPQLSSAQYVASATPVIYMLRKQGQFAVHKL